MTQEPCQILPWDTDFFGFRVGRVVGNTITPESMPVIHQFCRREGVRCLYFLASLEDSVTTHLAEDNDFHYVDTRLTFEHKLPAPRASDSGIVIRLARPEDVPALMIIARDSYVASRFYYDPNFSREACARLYETWIKVSCEETYAQAVIVAEVDGAPAGYVTCHIDQSPAVGRIGLVGVGAKAQGKGLGKLVVQRALEWFGDQGLPLSTVATQGRNLAAQRLYQRCGYVTQSVQMWYHKWYPPTES